MLAFAGMLVTLDIVNSSPYIIKKPRFIFSLSRGFIVSILKHYELFSYLFFAYGYKYTIPYIRVQYDYIK